MSTLVSEGIGAFIVVRVDIFFLVQKSFPYRNPYEHTLWNPFLVGVFLSVGRRIFPYIDMHGGQAIGCVRTITFILPLQLYVVSFPLLPHVDPVSMEPQTSYGRHVSVDKKPTSSSRTLLYALIPMSILTILPLSTNQWWSTVVGGGVRQRTTIDA